MLTVPKAGADARASGARITRGQFLAGTAGALSTFALGRDGHARPSSVQMLTRPIPSSGAVLPIVGCGTWRTFDVDAGAAARAPVAGVLAVLFAAGGSVIDSSPMYGRAEAVVGDLLAAAGSRAHAFLATKVWTEGRAAGIAQMERSFALLRAPRIDLMQIHNLLDWRLHLPTLRAWKREGRIGYLGVTHYTSSAYADLEAVMKRETLDFVQLNYSVDDRAAERRLLPLGVERGIAVIVNMPFGGGGTLRALLGRPLPGWAAEIGCTGWAQVLLKFVLGHPAVTCVIPGTSKPDHMRDNAQAGFGAMPNAALRMRMVAELGF
ncbi:MAG: aldo/keto reductase [Alphaproteobacteria bacterium]|nr:aldo/keto reductase [Alphaproteobacteria bacterium]